MGALIALAAGLVLGLRPARATSPEALLPNLIAERPTEPVLHAESFNGGPRRLLLRFNGYIHNAGRGALDMKGWREAPKLSHHGEEEFALWQKTHAEMSPSLERELAEPAMNVQQRLFTTSAEETNIERAHVDERSSAVMLYANADGHNHWHLQHVGRYSLWNSDKTAEAAPSQKVGFCLLDSQHVDAFGPSTPVYEDAVRGEFCERFKPQATSLREGISRGWKDAYSSGLAFQWVDVSNVAPGEYWLREDVNPDGVIKEEGTGEKFRYSSEPVIVPGYEALPTSILATGAPVRIKLRDQKWEGPRPGEKPSGEVKFTIVSGPKHGALGAVSGNEVTYTPRGSYAGPDSFTYSAHDGKSEFPLSATSAAVSITGEAPSVTISGAQPQMIEGTSVSLTATTAHDGGPVEWSATAGSLSSSEGASVVFVAPGARGPATITARLRDDPDVSAQVTIDVVAPPAASGAPEVPPESPAPAATSTGTPGGASGVLGSGTSAPSARLTRPRAMLFGRELAMSTSSTVAGRLRLSAYVGSRRLATCVELTPGARTFTCRVRLARWISLHARIAIVASLRLEHLVLSSRLPPRRIPQMRMRPVGFGARARTASGASYWCSPGTLMPVLSGGE